MHTENLDQIIANYIANFERLNSKEHDENYKWRIANTFKERMDKALLASDEDFANKLHELKKSTHNFIDNAIRPFAGLVEYAKKEPQTVREMFQALFANTNDTILEKQEKIVAFIIKSQALRDKYFPNSYQFAESVHSVSAYLFLYDPDHSYMYKASNAKTFTDYIEFYDDWGTGTNIQLEVYYRMCDEVLRVIEENTDLLEIHKKRYKERFFMDEGDLHPDEKHHILLFDLIYCALPYELFTHITLEKRSAKAKKLYLERQAKLVDCKEQLVKATADYEALQGAKAEILALCQASTAVKHKKYGVGVIDRVENDFVYVTFERSEKTVQLGFQVVFGNGILQFLDEKTQEVVTRNVHFLQHEKGIETVFWYANWKMEE